MMLKEKKFQTHRGFWVEGIMENTLESLVAAKKRGSTMVEFDVRLTRDYVPVLYHDKTLKRLHKAPVEMQALTLAQAKTFAPNLTTLEQVLASKAVPDFLNIELKTDAPVDPALEIKVSQLIHKYKAEERVVLSSFNPFSLIRSKTFMPEVARALLVSEDKDPKNYWFLKQMSLLPLTDSQFLHWSEHMTTKERVDKFMDIGYQIACYTVNDPHRAQELLGWGVHSIISDHLLTA
ncbi:glycerophosphodiester phosphodiesterase [Bdellovibrio sp. HCB337]|uniref:glycerophosphodiester phosphodiesterase n=1 Tax=Bdellovibrio sp. HCB337 TaxID=3394358 RepID=UPI0039A7256A